MWFIFYISFLFKGKLCKEGNIIYLFRLIIKRIHECVYAYNICHIHKNITSERYGGSYGAASTGPENYKSLRWISGEYPPDEIRRSHQVFGQWASKYQKRTNHSNVHARAENFSTYSIMYVLRQNYWYFMRFVEFLSFQLISLIRWKVLGPFWQPSHHSLIRWISAGYPPALVVLAPALRPPIYDKKKHTHTNTFLSGWTQSKFIYTALPCIDEHQTKNRHHKANIDKVKSSRDDFFSKTIRALFV